MTPTRALIPGDRYREAITDVLDTGRRRTRWMPTVAGCGHKQVSNVEALVQVPGESKPWWVELERLEPSEPDEHAAWLRATEEDRPIVKRIDIDVDHAKNRARRLYRDRLRQREVAR